MHLYYNADGSPFIPSQELWEAAKQLTTACAEGDLEAVRRILDEDQSGKLILGLSSKHNSPLLVALCAKQVDVARFLIEDREVPPGRWWFGQLAEAVPWSERGVLQRRLWLVDYPVTKSQRR